MENENAGGAAEAGDKQYQLQQKLESNREKMALLNSGIEQKSELLAKLNAEIEELTKLYAGSKTRGGREYGKG